jgi:uncharacterized MAPEG superfamily protein
MTLTIIILLVLALYMVQIFLQETSRFGFDLWGIVGNRDKLPEMSVVAGRLDRAKNNMLEALPIFIALALLALVKGGDTSEVTHAALIFLIARRLCAGLCERHPHVAVVRVVGGGCQPRNDGAVADLERAEQLA